MTDPIPGADTDDLIEQRTPADDVEDAETSVPVTADDWDSDPADRLDQSTPAPLPDDDYPNA